MYVDTNVWVADAYIRTVASLFSPIVSNGILYLVSHKLAVAEIVAEYYRVNDERVVHIHVLLPVYLLYCLIYLIGFCGLELLDRFEHFDCCACAEVCLVQHLVVASESHHSTAQFYIVSTETDEFLSKNFLESLKGFCYYLKFFHLGKLLSFLCNA